MTFPRRGKVSRLVGWAAAGLLAVVAVTAGIAAEPAPALTAKQERLLESLRREVQDKLLASGKISSVSPFDRLTLKVKSLAGKDLKIDLGVALTRMTADPRARSDAVQALVRSVVQQVAPSGPPPMTKDQFIGALRLLVREATLGGMLKGGVGARGAPGPLSRPLAGAAAVFVAIDRGESLDITTVHAAGAHGLSDVELFELAQDQINKAAQDATFEAMGPVRFVAAREASLSPSLILVAEIATRLEQELGADFLIAIPDRTVLLAAPARQVTTLNRVVAAIAEQHKSSPLIPHLIQRHAGGWVVYPSR